MSGQAAVEAGAAGKPGDNVSAYRLRVYITSLVGAALVAYVAAVAGRSAVGTHRIPAIVLVVLFALAEVFVVHFDFRRSSHTFSLVEVPVVLGLLYVRPSALVVAHLIGGGAALVAHRHQRPLKLAFNLSLFGIQDAAAIAVFYSVAQSASVISARTWLAAGLACVTSSLIAIVLVFGAMGLSADLPARAERLRSLSFGLAATLITTSAALALSILGETEGWAALLLVLPFVAIYLAHRSYVATRNERRNVETLHDSAALLLPASEPTAALAEMLARAQVTFGAELAALVYHGKGDAVLTSMLVGPGAAARPIEEAGAWWTALGRYLPNGGSRLSGGGRRSPRHDLVLPGVSIRDAMVVTLVAGDELLGYQIVANRLRDVGQYGADDLRVLETVGRQVAAVIAGDTTDISVAELRVLEGELRYRERHDGLTGLLNQSGLRERLPAHLADVGSAGAGVLVIEVDGVDEALALVGADALDELVMVLAQRLRRCVRHDDVAARLGGSQFAIAAHTPGGSREARALGARVRSALSADLNVAGVVVSLGASVGVSMSPADADPDAVLAAAFDALARARRPGVGLEVVELV